MRRQRRQVRAEGHARRIFFQPFGALLHHMRPFVLKTRKLTSMRSGTFWCDDLTIQRSVPTQIGQKDIFAGCRCQAVRVISNGTLINSTETLDLWLNAYEYHRDDEKRAAFEHDDDNWLPMDYSRALFIHIMLDRARAVVEIGNAIYALRRATGGRACACSVTNLCVRTAALAANVAGCVRHALSFSRHWPRFKESTGPDTRCRSRRGLASPQTDLRSGAPSRVRAVVASIRLGAAPRHRLRRADAHGGVPLERRDPRHAGTCAITPSASERRRDADGIRFLFRFF